MAQGGVEAKLAFYGRASPKRWLGKERNLSVMLLYTYLLTLVLVCTSAPKRPIDCNSDRCVPIRLLESTHVQWPRPGGAGGSAQACMQTEADALYVHWSFHMHECACKCVFSTVYLSTYSFFLYRVRLFSIGAGGNRLGGDTERSSVFGRAFVLAYMDIMP